MTDVMAPGARDDLPSKPPLVDPALVPFAITDDVMVPRERYYDKAFFELENEKLWPHVWQVACRSDEILNVGDYVEYSVAGYSILVIRSGPDEIKAFQNSCRHRATQLAVGCGTFKGGQIVCPFHAWRYNLDGSCARPVYGEEVFDPRVMRDEDLHLIECQVGEWAGLVFINMDRNAQPLMEFLQPLPEILDPLLIGEMRVDWWRGVRLPVNWKIAIEAFMEGYHVRGTHTQLTLGAGDDFPNPHDIQYSFPNGHAGLQKDTSQAASSGTKATLGLGGAADPKKVAKFMRMINEQLETTVLEKDLHVVESLHNVAPEDFPTKFIEAFYEWNTNAGIKLPERDPAVLSRWSSQWHVFPNFMIHPAFGNSILYRVRPDELNDPEHCYFEMWSVTLVPQDEPPAKPTFAGEFDYDDEEWPLIARQDYRNMLYQQRGMRQAGGNTRTGRWENGIANAHVHIDHYLAR